MKDRLWPGSGLSMRDGSDAQIRTASGHSGQTLRRMDISEAAVQRFS